MTRHPDATTVAMLIAAERAPGGLEESAATVLARFFQDWCDEQKSDLYALLAEGLTAGMTIAQMTSVCSRCLWDNQNKWTRRYG